MKKVFIVLLAVSLIAGTVFAGGQKASGGAAGEKQKHFVFVTPLIAHPVWLVAKEGFEDAAKTFNFRGDWVGPSIIDADEMIKQIEVAIAEKADGIVTMGMNPQAMVPVLKKADAAKIPVVVTNSDIPDAPRLAYLGTDPVNLGTIGGEAIVKKLNGQAPRVVFMVSALDYKIGQDIVAGYRNVFSKQPGYQEKAVLESLADTMIGLQKWQDAFNTYPDVNVAVCVSGEAAASCAKVVQEMGLTNKITIMGIDDIQETLDRIREGIVYGTMTQNFYRKGYQASEWILNYLKDGTKPAKLINDSGTLLVTKDNIATYNTDMKKPETWK
jgi:ABC-type sugar transport system substrate-binding protein